MNTFQKVQYSIGGQVRLITEREPEIVAGYRAAGSERVLKAVHAGNAARRAEAEEYLAAKYGA